MLEKARAHLKKHKTAYISTAVGIASAGFTVIVMRRRHAELSFGSDGQGNLETPATMRLLNFFASRNSANQYVTVVSREGRGHPGYIVKCLETDKTFSSQHQAAKAFDIPEAILSKHLNGIFGDALGYHFERLARID